MVRSLLLLLSTGVMATVWPSSPRTATTRYGPCAFGAILPTRFTLRKTSSPGLKWKVVTGCSPASVLR